MAQNLNQNVGHVTCKWARLDMFNLTPLLPMNNQKTSFAINHIVQYYLDLDCSDFFVLANSNRTRGHSCKLFTQQCSLDVRKYCFANRVVEPWNHLPDHIVRDSSVSLFRKLIDSVHLSGYCRY